MTPLGIAAVVADDNTDREIPLVVVGVTLSMAYELGLKLTESDCTIDCDGGNIVGVTVDVEIAAIDLPDDEVKLVVIETVTDIDAVMQLLLLKADEKLGR